MKPSDDRADSPDRTPRRSSGVFFLFLLLTGLLCGFSFMVGRMVERRSHKPQADPQVPETASSGAAATLMSADERRIQKIGDLHRQISLLNWDLVTPLKQYQSGEIDQRTLQRRTAEPELHLLQLCTELYEVANGIEDDAMRVKAVRFAGALLSRHRGMTMMIEGIVSDDPIRGAAGAKLFEESRNQALAAALEFGGTDQPEAELLRRLLESYESSQSASAP